MRPLRTLFLATFLGLPAFVSIAPSSAAAENANNTKTVKQALPDDQQPIHITADSLDIQDLKGISVYKGNVEITQGKMSLYGDQVTLYHPQRDIQKIEVTGQPARFKRFDPVEQSWVTGQADFIDYRATSKTVLLTGNAVVEQPGKHNIKGPKLFYDMQKQTLQAESTPQQKQRISVTITPENQPDKNREQQD
ncbi:lipopolysaccharide transport periplasmic protein LptA [Thiomicrorhabdus sp. zzn3]|uniref:lipopolysaccharide transport periplasmic protein LptA n=1 Tax=Thiomicrorhabdus sp. zzn3 TaxID=3039775 RepID=UPI0024371D4A|nr:lipopolysaccharide transport periplasmic protein LptA [Thiomicrorhabdus sp. zzn3]MDG6777418.1 lipopolysaccharide transport periplasmic protein LptA [Thiomicrorhabdus sp. zzn3]